MLTPLVALALFNTVIGLQNVAKNTAQYEHQKLTDAKIDRILELLEIGRDSSMSIDKYLTRLDTEIGKLIKTEAVNPTTAGERDLFFLFENRKHAKHWLEDSGVSASISTEPTKTYFGGD